MESASAYVRWWEDAAVSAANLEIARRGYEALARGDVEAIRELLDPAVRWHGGDPDAPGACHGPDEVLEFIRRARLRGPLPELVDVIDAGDQVVVVLRPAATPGQETGLRANRTRFRAGRIVEMVAHETPDDALTAARGHASA
jgi:ketosteroid isomerase-like protein